MIRALAPTALRRRGDRRPAGRDRRPRVRHAERVRTARCSSAFPAPAVDGHDLAWEAVERGAVAARRRAACSTSTSRSSRRRQPGRHGRRRGRVLRRADAGARGRRRHGDERQDDDGLPAARDARGGRAAARAGRHGRVEHRRRASAPRRSRPRRRSTSSGSSARCSTPATGASRSRRLRTGRRCGGSTASGSMRSSSRTCRRTTSTCTGRWRTTSWRSGRSSRARCHRLRRSTSTTSGARAWRELSRIVHRAPLVTFGLGDRAEIRAEELELTPSGSTFRAAGIELETRLRGRFNVTNVLGAVAAGLLLDLDEDAIVKGIASVDGRARPLRARRRRPGVHRARRLRAHAGFARDGARRGAGPRRGARARRVRGGWRPRPGQASAHGTRRGRVRGRRDRDLRQPALREPARHHPGRPPGRRHRTSRSIPTGARRSSARSASPRPETSC